MGPVAALSYQARPQVPDRAAAERNFCESAYQLLDRIDCRLAESEEEREAIFRLRYEAYLRDGGISPLASERFADAYDERGNVYLLGLYLDGRLASSIRIHVASKECPEFPSLEPFADILQPELDAGKVIVDPTRFVTDENLSRLHQALPHVTLRLCGMAAHHFNAHHLLAAIRVEHQAFYRRAFRHRLLCEARPYPQLAKPICLMTTHYPSITTYVAQKYPFLRSTFAERRMLFDGPGRRSYRHGPAPFPAEAGTPPLLELDTAASVG